jgi:hypothetical protein
MTMASGGSLSTVWGMKMIRGGLSNFDVGGVDSSILNG